MYMYDIVYVHETGKRMSQSKVIPRPGIEPGSSA